jgi:hypothetical protein
MGKFNPPTLEEVLLQASKAGLPSIEAEKFFCFYESKDWMVGKSKMKKWLMALSGWKLRWQESKNGNRSQNTATNPRNIGVCRAGPDYGEAAKRKQLQQQNEERKRQVAGQLAPATAGNGTLPPASA